MRVVSFLCLICSSFAVVLPQSRAAASCDNGWYYYEQTQSCYWAGDNMNFQLAEYNCQSVGAHLTSIANSFENAFVASLTETGTRLDDTQMTWIGLQYNTSSNSWQWTDGTSNFYTYWAQKYPSNPTKNNCVILLQDEYKHQQNVKGEWMNVNCGIQERKYVCKKPANMS